MGLFSWLFTSCSPKQQPAESAVPEVIKSVEDGFVDLSFYLASHERLADGTQVCVARGMHLGTEVGFRIRLPATWKQGTLGNSGLTTYQSTLNLESVGPASDAFMAMLSHLYEGSLRPTKMVPAVTLTAISLEGAPAQLEKGRAKIKLFCEPEEEGDKASELYYAELYLNIDLASRLVEFKEKDPEYRDPILRALSGTKQP